MRSAPTKARGIAFSGPRLGHCSVRGPSNAIKKLLERLSVQVLLKKTLRDPENRVRNVS
jgi:hypothetical protein